MREQMIHANKENELLALVKRNKICESKSEELIVDGLVNLTAARKIRPLDSRMCSLNSSASATSQC
jgi:hypothetical protein